MDNLRSTLAEARTREQDLAWSSTNVRWEPTQLLTPFSNARCSGLRFDIPSCRLAAVLGRLTETTMEPRPLNGSKDTGCPFMVVTIRHGRISLADRISRNGQSMRPGKESQRNTSAPHLGLFLRSWWPARGGRWMMLSQPKDHPFCTGYGFPLDRGLSIRGSTCCALIAIRRKASHQSL